MKPNRIALAVTALLGGAIAAPAQALNLYVDQKTSQVYTEPGPGRIKLGRFKQVDEEAQAAPAGTASAEDIKAVESRLNKKIDGYVNKPKKPNEAKITLDDHGLKMKTNDENFEFKLNGRIHADAALHGGDKFTTINGSEIDLTDGTEIRRARLEASGKFFKDFGFKFQPDYADNAVSIKDMFVNYTGLEWMKITLGQSKQPFSWQQMMSSNDLPFMERSIEYMWTTGSVDRAIGARFDFGGENWGAAFGWYGDTVTRQSESDDEGWGLAGRATYAPWYEPGELIHIGASAAYRKPQDNDTNGRVRYRFRPTHIDHDYIVDTGNMNPDDMVFMNAEAVGVWGPMSVEAEYNRVQVNNVTNPTTDLSDDAVFDGWHFDLIYSITGETRANAYDAKEGVIKHLKPARNFDLAGGWGAWEAKARVAYADINQVVNGGRTLAGTFGLNWYLNNWLRMMVDYTHYFDYDRTNGSGENFIVDGDIEGLDVVQMRASFAF